MSDKDQWRELARTPGLHPYSLREVAMGFLMTRESGTRFKRLHLKDSAC